MKAGEWFRRVVPEGYAIANITLTGTAPLLMHSAEADREGELFRAYYALGQKTKKSLDDVARLAELEWQLGIYMDEKVGPYIPGENIKQMLRAASTKWKKGEEVKRSLVVLSYRVPVEYDGPRDLAGLWADQKYRYTTLAVNSGASKGRVPRCRPKFEEWRLSAEIAYDNEDLDFDMLSLAANRARKYGIGDYRPRFGTFNVEFVKGPFKREDATNVGPDKIDETDSKAHEQEINRITNGAFPKKDSKK